MSENKIREPFVAGQFYPSSAAELKKQIANFCKSATSPQNAIACMLPHAGYIYSGKVAVETAQNVDIKDTIILLGPNHTGHGANFSIMSEGDWRTPLGDVSIDRELAKQLLKSSKYLKEDSLAHLYEHSLEVELPVLQFFRADFRIVPVIIRYTEIEALKELGNEVAAALKNTGIKNSAMIVASSDMTHYEPEGQAKEKDSAAINAILELNEDKLIERITNLNITMCGYAPAIVMIAAAKLLGAKSAKLIKYATSAEATGDKSSVVGYAGIVIS